MFQVKKPIEPRLYDGILFWVMFLPGITFFEQNSSQGKRIVVDRCNVTRLQRRVWLAVADDNKAPTPKLRSWELIPPVRSGQHCVYLVGCARGLRKMAGGGVDFGDEFGGVPFGTIWKNDGTRSCIAEES